MFKKSAILTLLVLLACLWSAADKAQAAVSKAVIFVDGQAILTDYYMQGNQLMVPAVFMKHAGFYVGWDVHYAAVVLRLDDVTMGLPANRMYADYYDPHQGRWLRDYLPTITTNHPKGTFIPLVYVVQKFGLKLDYDPVLQRTYITSKQRVDDRNKLLSSQALEEYYWFYQVTSAEAEGESYEGKVAVAASILNRVKSPEWPNTINEVIFQITRYNDISYYQYSPVLDRRIYSVKPSSETIRAVHQALLGDDPSKGAILFFNPDKTNNQWVRSRPVTVIIGNHVFAK
jgi:hypothetical protein